MAANAVRTASVKQFKWGSLWMLVAAFFFAIMGVLVKIASHKFSSAELVFYRSLVGLVFITSYVSINRLSISTQLIKMQMSRSIIGFISMVMFFYAISALPLASAITLNYTSPLAMAAILTITFHERPRKVLIFAIITGFIGVALLLKPSIHYGELVAGGLGLLSGLLAGWVYVQVAQLGRAGEPDWRTVFYFSLVCTLGGGAWMIIHHFSALELKDLPILAGLGTCATIAQLAMTRAYRTGNPLVVGSLAYTTVVLASLFGILLWNETLSVDRWLAIILIISSGVISVSANASAKKKS
ncbi:MAG: DMT family transporter [Methylophilaceae bacterium]